MSAPIDKEAEKKKNIRLALGVATAGILAFFTLYLVLCAVMILSPWLFSGLLPLPPLSEQVAGLDGKLLIFSKEINFRRASHENPQKETAKLSTYDGSTLSDPVEVPSFNSLYPAGDKVYLFEKGHYRTFDGKAWTEVKTEAIGRSPLGAADGGNIWVLSAVNGKPVLNLLKENETRQIALPDDPDKISVCSAQVLAVGGELHLFWENGYTLFWNRFDGEKWGNPETFGSDGRYKAIVFKGKTFLFWSRRTGDRTHVTVRTYDGNAWTKPVPLAIGGSPLGIMPAVFKEKPILVQRGFSTVKFYMLDEQGLKAEGPVYIRKPSHLLRHAWKPAGLVLAGTSYSSFLFISSPM